MRGKERGFSAGRPSLASTIMRGHLNDFMFTWLTDASSSPFKMSDGRINKDPLDPQKKVLHSRHVYQTSRTYRSNMLTKF
jgi:hypothetical protein